MASAMTTGFDVTARLKGALGETLLTEHKAAIREFFSDWCLADLQANSPDWIPDGDYRSTFDIGRSPHSYDVSIDGEYATWYPDVYYVLQFEPTPQGRGTFDPYTVEYPIEVKTGRSSELSANQRAVMATIEQQANPIVPLRVRVDIGELPDRFSVTPHRVTHTGDEPLPDYSDEDDVPTPASIGLDSESTTLSTFTEDGQGTPEDS